MQDISFELLYSTDRRLCDEDISKYDKVSFSLIQNAGLFLGLASLTDH